MTLFLINFTVLPLAAMSLQFLWDPTPEYLATTLSLVVMPIVSGFELTAELRNRNRAAKIVFVSGTPDYAIDAWQYHVNDYLITPITLEGIQHTLKSCFSDSGM